MSETKRVYFCHECGSRDVQHAMWVELNTGKTHEDFGSWCNGDNSWCEVCQAHVHIELEEAIDLENKAKDV